MNVCNVAIVAISTYWILRAAMTRMDPWFRIFLIIGFYGMLMTHFEKAPEESRIACLSAMIVSAFVLRKEEDEHTQTPQLL